MNSYFVIIGEQDKPLFEAEFFKADYLAKLEYEKSLHQFIAHASLDMVDAVMWTMSNNYLKAIDRYGEWYVSVFLAAAGERFILLHDSRSEESIRNFFIESHELYTKYTLNPFYGRNQAIQSGPFEVKIRLLAKRHLEK